MLQGHELSRNKLTKEGQKFVLERLRKAAERNLPQWLEDVRSLGDDNHSLPFLSLYASLLENPGAGEEWRSISFPSPSSRAPGDSKSKTLLLGQIADATKLEIHYSRSIDARFSFEETEQTVSLYDVHIPEIWFNDFIRKHFQCRIFCGQSVRSPHDYYKFSKGDKLEDVDDNGLRYDLSGISNRWDVGCRRAITCPVKFIKLAIPEDAIGWWRRQNLFIERIVASPFVVSDSRIRVPRPVEYVKWLSGLRKAHESSLTAAEPIAALAIAKALLQFVRSADKTMQGEELWAKQKGYNIGEISLLLRQEFGADVEQEQNE